MSHLCCFYSFFWRPSRLWVVGVSHLPARGSNIAIKGATSFSPPPKGKSYLLKYKILRLVLLVK